MTTVAIQHLLLFFPFVFSDVGKGIFFREGFFLLFCRLGHRSRRCSMAQQFARESDYFATATKGAFFAVVAKRVWVGIS